MSGSTVDRLVTESEQLRQQLLKTAARLTVFADALLDEVRTLRTETPDPEGDEGGRGEEGGAGPAG